MLASDIVMAVLVHLPDTRLEGSPLEIHSAFRKTAKKYQELFEGFTFGRPGGPVSSYAVEVAWDNLVSAGMLSTSNPKLIRHDLDDSARSYFDEYLADEFSEVGFDRQYLTEVASAFAASLASVRSDPARVDLLVLS